MDTCKAFRTMQQVLTDCFVPLYNPQARSLAPKVTCEDKKQAIVDIKLILATSFYLNSQNPDITIFSITLDKINYKIQDYKA